MIGGTRLVSSRKINLAYERNEPTVQALQTQLGKTSTFLWSDSQVNKSNNPGIIV